MVVCNAYSQKHTTCAGSCVLLLSDVHVKTTITGEVTWTVDAISSPSCVVVVLKSVSITILPNLNCCNQPQTNIILCTRMRCCHTLLVAMDSNELVASCLRPSGTDSSLYPGEVLHRAGGRAAVTCPRLPLRTRLSLHSGRAGSTRGPSLARVSRPSHSGRARRTCEITTVVSKGLTHRTCTNYISTRN